MLGKDFMLAQYKIKNDRVLGVRFAVYVNTMDLSVSYKTGVDVGLDMPVFASGSCYQLLEDIEGELASLGFEVIKFDLSPALNKLEQILDLSRSGEEEVTRIWG